MQREKAVQLLHTAKPKKRIKYLKDIVKQDDKTGVIKKRDLAQINIATTASFSPYTPTEAVYMAYNNGLSVCGISDTDTLAAVKEFVTAANACKLNYTLGCRTHAIVEGKRVGIMIYGITEEKVESFTKVLENNRDQSKIMAAKKCEVLNKLIEPYGYALSFGDIVKSSEYKAGGTVTQRHVYYAFANLLSEKLGKCDKVVEFIRDMGYEFSEMEERLLKAQNNPYYVYDLARILCRKADHSTETYTEFHSLNAQVKKLGGFCALIAKRNETDDAKKLVETLKEYGFDGVCTDTAIPNLNELDEECKKHSMLLLPWNHIDSPRKKFISDESSAIADNVWALVGDGMSLDVSEADGLFSETVREQSFDKKVKVFASIGKTDEAVKK